MGITDVDREELLARMTVEEKIGQLVLAALPGPVLDDATIEHLRAHHFGGVVLFSRNIETVEQTRALTAALRDLLSVDGLPPLIGVDQEGGRVQRLMPDATS